MEKSNEIKLFVIYVGVVGIRSEDIEDYVKRVTKKIIPQSIECEVICIPTQTMNTRIECINPKYITDDKLINEHNELMMNLNKELQHQFEILKNKTK